VIISFFHKMARALAKVLLPKKTLKKKKKVKKNSKQAKVMQAVLEQVDAPALEFWRLPEELLETIVTYTLLGDMCLFNEFALMTRICLASVCRAASAQFEATLTPSFFAKVVSWVPDACYSAYRTLQRFLWLSQTSDRFAPLEAALAGSVDRWSLTPEGKFTSSHVDFTITDSSHAKHIRKAGQLWSHLSTETKRLIVRCAVVLDESMHPPRLTEVTPSAEVRNLYTYLSKRRMPVNASPIPMPYQLRRTNGRKWKKIDLRRVMPFNVKKGGRRCYNMIHMPTHLCGLARASLPHDRLMRHLYRQQSRHNALSAALKSAVKKRK
jgi:hypothetical protein